MVNNGLNKQNSDAMMLKINAKFFQLLCGNAKDLMNTV